MARPNDSIQQDFETFKLYRQANCEVSDALSDDLREVIPNGLRNNIHWHTGHIVTVQASLLYKRSGLEVPVPPEYFNWFGKGTSPADWTDDTVAFEVVREDADRLLGITLSDLSRYRDVQYPETITVTGGVQLSSFAEALGFLAIHEALHLGAMNVMKRLLERQTER